MLQASDYQGTLLTTVTEMFSSFIGIISFSKIRIVTLQTKTVPVNYVAPETWESGIHCVNLHLPTQPAETEKPRGAQCWRQCGGLVTKHHSRSLMWWFHCPQRNEQCSCSNRLTKKTRENIPVPTATWPQALYPGKRIWFELLNCVKKKLSYRRNR